MITMIKSKAGQGGSNEMLRRFMCDNRDAVYISNKFDVDTVYKKITRLANDHGVNYVDKKGKLILTPCIDFKIDDYFKLIRIYNNKVLYLDLSMHMEERAAIKAFCYNIYLKYRDDIHMTEQLRANSFIDGVIIVRES